MDREERRKREWDAKSTEQTRRDMNACKKERNWEAGNDRNS